MSGSLAHFRNQKQHDSLRRAHLDASAFGSYSALWDKENKPREIPCNEIALPLQAYRIAFGLMRASNNTHLFCRCSVPISRLIRCQRPRPFRSNMSGYVVKRYFAREIGREADALHLGLALTF